MAMSVSESSETSSITGNVFRHINQAMLGSWVSNLNTDSDGIPAPPFMIREPRVYFNNDTQRWVGYYRPTGRYGWIAGYCIPRDHGPRDNPVKYSCYSRRCLRPLKVRKFCRKTHRLHFKKKYRLRLWGSMRIDPSKKDLKAIFESNS